MTDVGLRVVLENFPDFGGVGDVLRASAKAYWKFDSNGNDSTGRSNTLTLVNSPEFTAGHFESCIVCDKNATLANSKYAQRDTSADLELPVALPFSMAGWFYVDNLASYPFVAKKNDDFFDYVLDLEQDGSDWKFGWAVGDDGFVFGSTVVSAATWYFVVVDHNPVTDQISISVNNGAKATGSCSLPVVSDAKFKVGAYGDPILNNTLDGRVGELYVSHSEISSNEISYFWNNGAGRTLFP